MMRIRYAENIWPGHPGTYRTSGLVLEVGQEAEVAEDVAQRMLADFPKCFVVVEEKPAPVPSREPAPAATTTKPKRRRRKAAPKKEST